MLNREELQYAPWLATVAPSMSQQRAAASPKETRDRDGCFLREDSRRISGPRFGRQLLGRKGGHIKTSRQITTRT